MLVVLLIDSRSRSSAKITLPLSENAWEVTVNFKDNIITLINSAATSCPPQATASDLARKILEHYISSDLKGDQILKIVKAEIQ